MDLKDLIEQGVPAPPPVRMDRHLAAGRRAVRRARLAAAAAGTALVLAVGGTAWALAGTTPGRDTVPAATGERAAPDEPAAAYDQETGRLDVNGGWEVAGRVASPVTDDSGDAATPYRSSEHSVALDLRRGEEQQWLLLTWSPDAGSTSTMAVLPSSYDSFEDWLAVEVAAATGTSTDLLVALRGDGTLTPRRPVSYLDQRPALPRGGSSVILAKATVSGETWFLVVVADGGRASAYPVRYDGDSLSDFASEVEPDVAAGRYP